MLLRRILCLIAFLPLLACGRGGGPAPTDEPALEPVDVLTLRLSAREQEIRRLRTRLEADSAHSRFKITADLDGLQERLTDARLKLDTVKASDSATRGKAHRDFSHSLSDLTILLREVESRYAEKSP